MIGLAVVSRHELLCMLGLASPPNTQALDKKKADEKKKKDDEKKKVVAEKKVKDDKKKADDLAKKEEKVEKDKVVAEQKLLEARKKKKKKLVEAAQKKKAEDDQKVCYFLYSTGGDQLLHSTGLTQDASFASPLSTYVVQKQVLLDVRRSLVRRADTQNDHTSKTGFRVKKTLLK